MRGKVGTKTHGQRMHQVKEKCSTCKKNLYITRLQEKLFCRTCWEYKEVKVKS